MLEQIRRLILRDRNARRVQLRQSCDRDDMQDGAAALQLIQHVLRRKAAVPRRISVATLIPRPLRIVRRAYVLGVEVLVSGPVSVGLSDAPTRRQPTTPVRSRTRRAA